MAATHSKRIDHARSLLCSGMLVALALLSTACPGPRSETAGDTQGVFAIDAPRTLRPATLAERLAARVDASEDLWDSEVLSDQAQAQLEEIRALIEDPASIRLEAVSRLVDDRFRSAALRPGDLREVFRDARLSVRRWQGGRGDEASTPATVGAAAFESAIRELTISSAVDVDADLEIFRIEELERAFSTKILFTTRSVADGRTTQRQATWSALWTYPDTDSRQPPRLLSIDLEDYQEVESLRSGPGFVDVTAAAMAGNDSYRLHVVPGIDHWLDRIPLSSGVSLFGHHGLAIGDVNGDGLEDLYWCETGGLPNRLFLQNADGTVKEAAKAAGIDWLASTPSALLIDLDNDGDQDLVAAAGPAIVFAENDGRGRFTIRSRLPAPSSATSMSAADYDRDGDLDIYVCSYDPDPNSQGLPGPVPYHDANNGGANVLLRNDGSFRFVDATRSSGLDANNSRFSFAAAWEDYDNDGDADLYVANDFGRNNLYRNDGGHFSDVAREAGVEDIASGMSVTWGDSNRDGHMDLYVSNMFSKAGNRVTYQNRFTRATASTIVADIQRMARGNTLFLNNGDGSFSDASESAGVTMGRWAWASKFADLNNDGWQDLVVANGYISNEDSDDL